MQPPPRIIPATLSTVFKLVFENKKSRLDYGRRVHPITRFHSPPCPVMASSLIFYRSS